jgi:hypothetical protein
MLPPFAASCGRMESSTKLTTSTPGMRSAASAFNGSTVAGVVWMIASLGMSVSSVTNRPLSTDKGPA